MHTEFKRQLVSPYQRVLTYGGVYDFGGGTNSEGDGDLLDYVTIRRLSDYRVNVRGIAATVARALGSDVAKIDDSGFGRCESPCGADGHLAAAYHLQPDMCDYSSRRAQYWIIRGSEIGRRLLKDPEFPKPFDVSMSRPAGDSAGKELSDQLRSELDALCGEDCLDLLFSGLEVPEVETTGLAMPNTHKCGPRVDGS